MRSLFAEIRSNMAHCLRVNSSADHSIKHGPIAAASNFGSRSQAMPAATWVWNSGSVGLSSKVARNTLGNCEAILAARLRRWNMARIGFLDNTQLKSLEAV